MKPILKKFCLYTTIVLTCWFNLGCEKKIDYSTQVKPILNKKCISCHGGVKRNGNFSLLFRHEALDTTESGKPAIIPFEASHSEMIRRLKSTDPEQRMPYKEEPLTDKEIEILTAWIDQGAEWGDHWAYVKPNVVTLPGKKLLGGLSSTPDFIKNDIDLFILEKLEEKDIEPAPEADRATLVRRVYLDLIGIPPAPEQAFKFIQNNDDEAYETLVDSLLMSPHFGEKWAAWWLDLARYADTKGYERDVGRTIWRYRDWVINAFNKDMPFDQFTIEQLAGDLLPEPTDDNLIATAFHRNTMNNDEGGTEDEEFRVAALLDRVNTTWEVWQSTTMACVQCHSHPYDPFVHEDYYKSLAFFNNTRDEDTHGEHPNLRIYQQEDEKKVNELRAWVMKLEGKESGSDLTKFLKTLEPKYHAHDFDQFVNGELIDTKFLGVRHMGSARLRQIDLKDKDFLLINYSAGANGGSIQIRLDDLRGPVIASVDLPKIIGKRKVFRIDLKQTGGIHDLYFSFRNALIPKSQPVADIEWFAFRKDLPQKNEAYEKTFMSLLEAQVDNTPVMIENGEAQRRESFVFERGNWLVKGKAVTPGVPESLHPFPQTSPSNRLGLAQWIVSTENPLTSRVIVNRIWEQIFGSGIVETLEDFGTQCAQPTHPQLLDWLALRLVNDHHWRLKKIIKDMVMSGTYRQSSKVTAASYEADPSNMYLSRGPRFRLSAEQIRDQALAAGGLLSPKMYGKSVMPFQPQGIWSSVWNGAYWKKSEGEDQYRRSIYTYIKRTSPYPSSMLFDGSSREVCVSRRIRTNTPLQALVTLNDSTYIVAARSLAGKMLRASPATTKNQIQEGYRTLLFKDIDEEKSKILMALYDKAYEKFKADEKSAKVFMANENALPEQAALTVVAQTLLNLDEVITKE